MYFWKRGTIANKATSFKEVKLSEATREELRELYEESRRLLQKGDGDVTVEDVRLIREKLGPRFKSRSCLS